ncbi:HlyD family efflux transporter periplasmic adaptor subunit [Streptomyces cadmiisoli]|uniref:HlyD family efflux transporter periplasmic adaptor subunit n=1 Tax=Streptomyces cadmiisoli TaxID=2184053 RepID=UPI0013A6A66A|nr:HlyD family efflux transporter periplasmic adaptor subunit [Streptomyces cadmiisoli]
MVEKIRIEQPPSFFPAALRRRAAPVKFRQQALAKLQSPTVLDAPIQLAQPRNLLSLAVVALLVVCGGVWAVTGSIPRQTTATGILTHAKGSIYFESPHTGQITGVFVTAGSIFPAKTPLFNIQSETGERTVRSTAGGRIISLLGSVGQQISQGAQLAVIERVDDIHDPVVAALYVPQSSAGLVRVGSQVDLDVRSAPSKSYGILRGTVESIGQFPQTESQIASFLGDAQLAKTFTMTGQPMSVIVRITPDSSTISGFSWSRGAGPPYQIDSRSLVTGAIHLAPIKPVDWISA